jgi:Ca2+-binding RTX toxin-like protein
LAAGASATFTLVVLVDSDVVDGTEISNSVVVTTTTTESNPANNSAFASAVVGQPVAPGLPDCEVLTFNLPGSPSSATLGDDADNPGTGVLIVTGTSGNDVIVIEPRPSNSSQIRVKRNGQLLGIFSRSAVQHIVAFGLAGNDTMIVNATLSQQATLFGDAGNDLLFAGRGADGLDGGTGNDRLFGGGGNDTLCGGDGNDFVYGQAGNDLLGGDAGNDRLFGEAGNDQLQGSAGNDFLYGGTGGDLLFGQTGNDQLFGESGNDIAVGGDGNDRLFGGTGRDLAIGGDGVDTLFGEAHDDILVAGPTIYDEDVTALQAILAEWTSSNSYTTRVNNIRFGGGANGPFTLDEATVIDDGLIDTLWGNGGLDWFLFGSGDKVKDKTAGELVN